MMASSFLCISKIGYELPAGRHFFEFNDHITFTWCHQEAKLMTVFLELLFIKVQYLHRPAAVMKQRNINP